MDESLLNQIESDRDVQEKINKELVNFSKLSFATQRELAKNYVVESKIYEEAIKLMGDVIYDKTVENEALKFQLGEVDQVEVQKKVRTKLVFSKEDAKKNATILRELKQALEKSRKGRKVHR